MNKICTSIEQSQKLIKLEIDVNTADMFYCNGHVSVLQSSDFITVNSRMREIYPEAENYIPAWSLTALLELMNVNEYKMALKYGNCSEYTMCFDDNYTFNSITKDDAIDSVFKMFVWLKENGKL